MKRMKTILLVLIALMSMPLAVSAYETDVILDGVRYDINTITKTAVVVSNSYTGDVVIRPSVTYEYDGTVCVVKSIGDYAFDGCDGLTSVSIPNSVTKIGVCSFRGCSSLTSVSIPNSVKSIERYAFDGCSGLTSLTIGNGVETIGMSAFYNCSGLTSLDIPNSVTSMGDGAFQSCTGLTSVSIPNSIKSLEDHIFWNCPELTSVSIPSSVTSIGIETFYNCTKLSSISIPSSVTSIGNGAFRYSGLISIDIPGSVTSMGERPFANCPDLTSVNISEGAKSIGSYAFEYCTNLSSVSIPSSVTSIGYGAFANCGQITTLEVNIETPLPIDSWSFAFCDKTTLYVPEGSKALYEVTENWSHFSSIGNNRIVEMPKCATPTISYANGKVRFACETKGVKFIPTMTCVLQESLNKNEMEIGGTYTISVYAKKEGYCNSSVATTTISANKMGDFDGDGELSVTDVTSLVNAILGK